MLKNTGQILYMHGNMTKVETKHSYQLPGSVVLHQLHFIPWVPFIAKLASASAWIILDDVQFRPRYYQNRTRIRNPDGLVSWLTVPVIASRKSKCNEVQIHRSKEFAKLADRIYHCWCKKPFFSTVWTRVHPLLQQPPVSLQELNMRLVQEIFLILEVEMPTVYFSSQLSKASERTDRMIESCQAIDKNLIISGWGMGSKVHDRKRLSENGLQFIASNKERASLLYDVCVNEGVSILDVLVNKGPQETRELVYGLSTLYDLHAEGPETNREQ